MEKIKLLEESNRCLKCKNHPCKNACPIGTEIPKIIEMFQNNECIKAGEKLFKNNPISLVCSLICPFEKQCMGSCIRGIKSSPVNFPAIENYIMEKYLKHKNFDSNSNKDKKIAIVGAGPAGISGAFYLKRKGYSVTMYDNHERIGGMLRYGIPEFRLKKHNIDLIEKKIEESGIKFKGNIEFTEYSLKNLKSEKNYDAVLVTTGAWMPKKIDLEGSERENVYYAIDYLKNNIDIGSGKKVVVIGAGNVAMDVSRVIKRSNNEVTIAYRRKIEEAPATKLEIQGAVDDEVNFITEVTPVKILDKGILLKDNNKGIEILLECDYIILAISQTSQFKIENLEGYFFAGDALTGPKTVVKASFTGRESAKLIDEYLKKTLS